MAGTFSITAPGNNIMLSGTDRQASVTYTVTNTSGKDLRGRAMVATTPANAPHLAWLAIEGESERPFGINATEQYRVSVQAPPDAPPGNYTIRLNMLATYNPDETFTEGPTVLVTVPAPTPETRKFPLWTIPVALVAVVIVAVILVFALRPRSIMVPDVVGMTVDDALDELEGLGLRPRPGGSEFSPVTEGRVARTDPAADSEVEREARVTWYLSDGLEPTPTPAPTPTPTPVPDIVDSFATHQDAQFTFRYPPEWTLVPCGFCAGEGGSIYALGLAANEAMRASLAPIFATGDLGSIDYGDGGAMFVLLQSPDFTGEPAELLKELLDGGDIDLLEINDFETLREPTELTLNDRRAATATIRGLDTVSNRLLVFEPWIIEFSASRLLIIYAATPIDQYDEMESLWDGILRTLDSS